MQTAVTTGGRARGASLSAALRVSAAALLAAVIALAPALLPDSAYADEGDGSAKSPYDLGTREQLDQGELVQPGLIETDDGQYAYADSLTDSKDEVVTRVATVVGNIETLSGGFSGGWGTVTYTWETCEGDDARDLLEQGVAVAPYLAWELVGEAHVKGQGYQIMNSVARVGGRSQTLNLKAMNPGYSAWKLTASDELGFSKSTYWVMNVAGDSSPNSTANGTPESNVSADTLVNLITNDVSKKTPVVTPIEKPKQDTTPTVTQVSNPPKVGFTRPGTMPQTGDEILRIVCIAVAVLAAAAAIGIIVSIVLRLREARREALLYEALSEEARR